MLIRPLTEEDADALFNLRLRALQESPEAFGSTYQETVLAGKQNIQERLLRPHDQFFYLGAFAAEESQQSGEGVNLVGMVGFYRESGPKSEHKGYIISMFVEPRMRGQGIGKALVSDAIARVRTVAGLEQLLLGVVTTNTAARSLYRSLGFKVFGLEPRALKQGDQHWDEELMILRLE